MRIHTYVGNASIGLLDELEPLPPSGIEGHDIEDELEPTASHSLGRIFQGVAAIHVTVPRRATQHFPTFWQLA